MGKMRAAGGPKVCAYRLCQDLRCASRRRSRLTLSRDLGALHHSHMPYMSTEHRGGVRPSWCGRRSCRSQGVSARASLTYFERDLPFPVRRFDPHMHSALRGDSHRSTLACTTSTGNSANTSCYTHFIPPLLVVPRNLSLDGMRYLRRSRAARYRILTRMLDSLGTRRRKHARTSMVTNLLYWPRPCDKGFHNAEYYHARPIHRNVKTSSRLLRLRVAAVI